MNALPTPTSLVALLLALACGPLAAADLQVYVTTPDGKPAPDVVVAVMLQGAAPPPAAAPAEPALIVQKDVRFQPYVTGVPLGATVRFINRDRFDHHMRSVPGGPLGSIAPAKEFDFRLAAASRNSEPSIDVKMDAAGATTVGCHLHGSMRAHIFVSPTPWVAVTNAAGRATLTGVPDGAVDLRLWHPDQLLPQANLSTRVAGSSSTAEGKLNFTPRRRWAAPPKGEYDQ